MEIYYCWTFLFHTWSKLKVSRYVYMKEFDKRENGELYEQLWVKEEAKKFYIQINSLANKFHCPLCGELWPCEKPICETCKKDKEGKFTRANDMVPNLNNLPIEIQKYFEDLTMIEEQLISLISAITTVFRQPSGQLLGSLSSFVTFLVSRIHPFTSACSEFKKFVSSTSVVKFSTH